MIDLLITNGEVYIDGEFKRLNIGVNNGKIVSLDNSVVEAKEVYDAKGKKIIPGLIDPHVHFELFCGTKPSIDDFYYGSKSAIYGGVTTIIDFLDPTRNAKELEESFYIRKALAEKCNIDYHFHACIKEPNGDLTEYVKKMKELGMNTIKLFTTYSETHRRTYDKDIIELLKLSKQYDFVVCAHIENDEMINRDKSLLCTDISEARNSDSETIEALKLCKYAADTGGNLYMVHCSSGNTLSRIKNEYGEYLGKNIFVESCPQYFVFNKEVLKKEDGYKYTFAPPLRSEEERKLMCDNFDYLSTIGTDHCSFMLEDKKNHPLLDGHPLGIGGIETSYVIMDKLFGDKVINKMVKNTAKIERFSCKSGTKIGNDADFAIVVDRKNIISKPHGKCDYSVYEGIEVNKEVISTILRGKFLLKDGVFIENKGRLINCDK